LTNELPNWLKSEPINGQRKPLCLFGRDGERIKRSFKGEYYHYFSANSSSEAMMRDLIEHPNAAVVFDNITHEDIRNSDSFSVINQICDTPVPREVVYGNETVIITSRVAMIFESEEDFEYFCQRISEN